MSRLHHGHKHQGLELGIATFFCFRTRVLLQLAAIKPPSSNLSNDVLGWKGTTSSSLFMVRSTYDISQGVSFKMSDRIWQLVHRYQGP
ncbi:hypothetical protein V6N12_017917 [Hibiscus sabdariffa]|uniref:Uncharacterized protein n=1 Tax=Hibiscus sabdariffa TaxID=183260 RepID=A0ABR2BL35_9ROSI